MKNFLSIVIAGAFVFGAASMGAAAESGAQHPCSPQKHAEVCEQEIAANSSAHNHHDHGATTAKELSGEEMKEHLVPMTKTISESMQLLSKRISKDLSPAAMKKWAEALDAVSSQALRLSDFLNNGSASEAELHMLHQEIDDTAKNLK